jgi:hypothetical protein
VARGQWPDKLGVRKPTKVLKSRPATRADIIAAATTMLFGRAPTPQETTEVTKFLVRSSLRAKPKINSDHYQETVVTVLTLLASSPAFLTR